MAATTHMPVARVPFAPLDSPRLRLLASAKNRQNGLVSVVATGKAAFAGKSVWSTPTKRPAGFDEEDAAQQDSENVDPSIFIGAKRSKSDPAIEKPFAFTFNPTSMPPPPSVPARLSTPVRANISSPRAPLTAPAGRSPKRKTTGAGILKTRRTSAPFARIDPPAFTRSLGSVASSMPFSLDAALSGTLAKATSTQVVPAVKQPTGATIAESMPKTWFFDIYEDTPEEEASNLMEHSTLTLDLGSDDEATAAKVRDDRGKENCPPEGYDASTASRPAVNVDASNGPEPAASSASLPSILVPAADISAAPSSAPKRDVVRRKKLDADAMDDGLRTPLGELETESAPLPSLKERAAKSEILIWEDDRITT